MDDPGKGASYAALDGWLTSCGWGQCGPHQWTIVHRGVRTTTTFSNAQAIQRRRDAANLPKRRAAALTAENARLRAALERIAAGECDCGNWQAPVEEHGSRCERRIADAALKDGGGTDGPTRRGT